MTEGVLVVDVGARTSAAAVVGEGRAALLRHPRSGATLWPSGAGLDVALLGSLRHEAERAGADRVERLTLTVASDHVAPDRRRDTMISIGEAAGFVEVELLSETTAAVCDAYPAGSLPVGALVLVCDLGVSWTTALAMVGEDGDISQLAQETSPAGRDLDARIEELRGEGEAPYQISREWLARLAEPGLRWVVASCRGLLARAAAGLVDVPLRGIPARSMSHVAPADVAGVVMVGGGARLPNAEAIVEEGLGRRVLRPDDPELAVVRGAARWVADAPRRRVAADHPKWRVDPLRWDVPGGRARLVRWGVAEGQAYRKGSVVAQVRTPDERVFDLVASHDGVLLPQRARIGDIVGPSLVAASKRAASCLAGDPPEKMQELSAAGEWLLMPDRRHLVECAVGARHVKLWSIPDGRLMGEFVPTFDTANRREGRVFIDPAGRPHLVAWDPQGWFSVWDVRSGERTATFRDPNAPLAVMVNERKWRLTTEGEDAGSAGRYRRSVATMWDLATGRRLEKLPDDWQRRLAGYRQRSAVDGFGDDAVSPDGSLHAVAVRGPSGAAIALQESASESEVFRTEDRPSQRVRMAFTADGQFLLANWESDDRSQVDVWEL